MFSRILLPTDFSTASEWVFDDAVRIAAAFGSELTILHVRMTRTSRPGALRFPADPSLYEYAEQQELERLRDRIRNSNSSVATRLIVRQAPDPGKEITRVAAEEKIDLIIIATHARHHVAHLLVGSTTHAVLADPPCSVLAIRYGIRKRKAMKRIVVPVHLEQQSHTALELAARVAEQERGEVHLVTVCKDEDRHTADRLQGEHASRFAGVTTKQVIVRGTDVEREILRYGEKVDADAVFLNATGAPSERKLEIIRHAPVPVMLVP